MSIRSESYWAATALGLALAGTGLSNEYMVVDLSGGQTVTRHPITYLDAAPGGSWSDEYKTAKLVLRRIPAGTFTMGSPVGELGRSSGETQHAVTLTKDYYIGVFEVTQRQWQLLMGSRVSKYTNSTYYATRPVETVSYNQIREIVDNTDDPAADWPANSAVGALSFMGYLRAHTGLATFDLPTEAQWEYACRAGTTTALSSGKNLTSIDSCPNVAAVGRYYYNGGQSSGNTAGSPPSAGTALVGSYLPNPWGLYDMHGNVSEWCLDWAGTYPVAAADPKGAAVGWYRIVRGGGWGESAWYCRSAHRRDYWPDSQPYGYFGFRVASAVPTSFNLTVVGGSGGDVYMEGTTAAVVANPPPSGQVFKTWTVSPAQYTCNLSNALASSTAFTIPGGDATVTATYTSAAAESDLYLVIDLSRGPGATSYPVSYLNAVPNGGWTEPYKTSKLVMRKLSAGTFVQGSSPEEMGRGYYTDETQHAVTLTKSCYIGVFEVTQRQWELVMGDRPSYYTNLTYYAARPVECLTYLDIREGGGSSDDPAANWPANSAVTASSFIGRLRAKTGLATLDLPTEAQWEYACRAGTAAALGCGRDLTGMSSCSNLSAVGRFFFNGGSASDHSSPVSAGTAQVGSYQPNQWGLYDMHGNVQEWCLDWYAAYPGVAQQDPYGPASGTYRVRRNGGWQQTAKDCRSASRGYDTPGVWITFSGFRVARTLTAPTVTYTLTVVGGTGGGTYATGASVSVTAGVAPNLKTFSRWAVSPASANLGSAFSPAQATTTITMPAATVTLTATYVAIPKLTVVGGFIDGEGGSSALVLPNAAKLVVATNAAGRVFEKWTVVPASASLGEGFNPRLAETTVMMPSVGVTLTAVHVTAPGYVTVSVSGYNPNGEIAGIYWSVDNTTWTLVNDETGYPLKAGSYTFSFKSATLSWLAPAKQTVKVTAGAGVDVRASATYVPLISWQLSEDSAVGSGTVVLSPANGQVLPGKGVTLTAKPANGFGFVGWRNPAGLPEGSERNPLLKVTPAADSVYTACFRVKTDCEPPALSFPVAPTCMVGVAYRAAVNVSDGALPATFTALSLPTGLKLDPVTGVISGVPTRAGLFAATLKATNAKAAATPKAASFTVLPLPVWAQGTFNGASHVVLGDREDVPGSATLSVSSLGSISGKFSCGGTNYTFSASSYKPMEDTFGSLTFEAEAKAGNKSFPLSFNVWPASHSMATGDDAFTRLFDNIGLAVGADEGWLSYVELYRNGWSDPAFSTLLTPYVGYYTAALPGGSECGSGYLTLTVDKAGNVKTGGKLADGTAVSLSGQMVCDGDLWAVLYTAPAAYKGGSFFGCARFYQAEGGTQALVQVLYENPFLWENRSPLATSEYGNGFARELDLVGGWYNKVGNLYDYYHDRALSVGTVEGAPVPALWAGTNRIESVWWNPNGLVLTAVTNKAGVLTGLAAPKTGLPVKIGTTAYDYGSGTNTMGLTIAVTPATGLFKGSFMAWFDYATTHTSKTIPFEGALSPVRAAGEAEGRGFFLSDDKGTYLNATGKPVVYPFKASYDFLLLAE